MKWSKMLPKFHLLQNLVTMKFWMHVLRVVQRRRARTKAWSSSRAHSRFENIFYGDLLNEDGTLKSQDELVEHFKAKAVNLDKPVITSCGSGVTAAIINLALDRIGKSDHSLYDGSWTEWGMYPTVPVETGDT